METWRFDAIGTVWEVETEERLGAQERVAVSAVIDRFDAEWSRFRADSVVSRIAAGGRVPAPADAAAMLGLYRELSDATAGAVNPLTGASLVALGYDASYSLVPSAARPAPEDWTRALQWTDAALSLEVPAVIDVGALGKGRLVDLVLAELVRVDGRVVVDAGGDLAVRGGSIRVALEHPYDTSRAVGVVEVRDRALCASATNRRAWGDGLHHVLDARTGLPVRRWAATWALAPDAMLADAATTALFFDGGPAFADARGIPWVRMATDGRMQASPGFLGELFLAGMGE
ncbi:MULTISPECIES: FAD:protein FMN transferase [unclassified Microbacterium]|uniref:FAD:protein FMN transferase n=1 Tax=unclassified Microbacterium TaxID=2609290 RepID=UPI0012F7B5B7|nr:FAD:protein FMN transferase [Microbacterium sp. MAH-37]MVQ41117.1 FAD:protein FMN transferase [Microbacterium sp. MAH-37]